MDKQWQVVLGTVMVVIGIGLIVYGVKSTPKERPEEEVEVPHAHYHAGFQVFVNNELQDFSDLKYMKIEPCGDHDEKADAAEEQLEKAHLHDGNGDVAHMHRDNVTWGDLFTNIEYTFDDSLLVRAYVNGELLDGDIFTTPIKADDSVVFLVGRANDIDDKLTEAVTIERIREVEALSEKCGTGS